MRAGSRVADVGCDHGQLGAWLLLNGAARRVIATDIHEQPLEKARALFARLGLTQAAETRLCDGLTAVSGGEVDDIVIAGLGGETILDILDAAPWLREANKRLILVPASRHAALRRGLCARGFEIFRETAVCESGHAYTVMTAGYTGAACDPGAVFAALGRVGRQTPDETQYWQVQYRRALRLMAAPAEEQKRRDARTLARYIEEETSTDGQCKAGRGESQ